MKQIIALTSFALATACLPGGATSDYPVGEPEYHLVELDGAAFTETATIQFPEAGRVVGQAPCNSYFGSLTSEYPTFALDAVGATKMACPDLVAEDTFFAALEEMTTAELNDAALILSNGDGRKMVFEPR
ncbi:META domain-containing protein [Thalassorhabdomicrobium marinisediminis]|uniref:META domain-containing protein n=1 Tax=Thalassorhabdomicrobium marinisediminis TaxID=2170577 RepID=A0A2T7FW33_9RHOB|nr:META domain-containing protein [Thalassorhabdomicrobium marinisediminis]PVA06380.1 META domain-containing protein [Thalassorhabdomicrobium marinisediminis]